MSSSLKDTNVVSRKMKMRASWIVLDPSPPTSGTFNIFSIIFQIRQITDYRYWPHHRVYFRFADSVIKEDREVIREVMAEIEDNTCVTFVETQRRRYKYLTITTEKSYNCMMCYYLGFVCPLKNGGSVRSSPFCTKARILKEDI